MIYVRARNAAEKLELLEDTSTSPSDWIVTWNGHVCSVGSEGSARSQFSWLELLTRTKENALSDEAVERLRHQVAAWLKLFQRGFIQKPKPPGGDPDPEPDFGM